MSRKNVAYEGFVSTARSVFVGETRVSKKNALALAEQGRKANMTIRCHFDGNNDLFVKPRPWMQLNGAQAPRKVTTKAAKATKGKAKATKGKAKAAPKKKR